MRFQSSIDHFLLGHMADILDSKHFHFGDFNKQSASVVCMNLAIKIKKLHLVVMYEYIAR